MQDIRYAARTLRKSPGFAVAAIATLATGVGASTAVFTAVDSIILKPLTFFNSGSLVLAKERFMSSDGDWTGPNPRHADVWQHRATSFSGLVLARQSAYGLSLGTDHPHLVGTVLSQPDLFDVLHVKPLLGRTFLPRDGVKDQDRVAILSYALWQDMFQGDSNIVGKTVRLADVPREVVGILPADFRFPNKNSLREFRSQQSVSNAPEPAIFIPVAFELTQYSWNGEYGNWNAIGRLKPGVSVAQAESELNGLGAQIVREMPAGAWDPRDGSLRAHVLPMQEAVVGEAKSGLWLLMAAVMSLMLIACLNLANTQLGRTLSRQREAAVRTALGASAWRLVWNSWAENLLLAVIGGSVGVVLAAAGLNLFRLYAPVDLPRLSEVHLNSTVLLFSLALTIGSSVLFGTLPALKLMGADPQAALQQGSSRAMGSRQGRLLRSWLIGLQVFGCTVLLLLTGLFAKSLLHLMHQEKGFETAHVAVAEVSLSGKQYSGAPTRLAFDDAVLQNLQAIAGVQTTGLVSAMPLEGETWIESLHRVDRPQDDLPLINLRWVSPGYFETLSERLVAGRFFEDRDRNLNSVILSEGEAKRLWPHEDPIGGQIRVRRKNYTVIGVVADARSTSLKSAPAKTAYLHYKDQPPYSTFFVARGMQSGEVLAAGMRQAIWKYAPDVTIARVKALDSQLLDSLAAERFQTLILSSFGIAALLLSMLGIYGVLSYSIATRRQEIGVRMALGATPRKIYSLAFGDAGPAVLAGLGAGLIASVLAGRLTRKLLYGIAAVDPWVMLIVAALFLTAALAAAFLPARRAASVDPMETLRAD